MRMKRLLGTATAAAVLLAGPLSAAALAQEAEAEAEVQTGVGTGTVSSTLLGVDIGDLLNLDLVDDLGLSTIDPVNGVPLSNGVFNPLKLTSSVLGPLSLGSISTSTTGEEDVKAVSDPLPGNVPLPIVSGLLQGTLSSVVDGDGARSNLLAGIGDLSLIGGLLGLGGNDDALSFNTSAAPATASGVRALDIPSLDLLNLGSLLAGLGLPLENLPLLGDAGGVLGLLEPLGVTVPGEDGDMDGDQVIDTVTGLLDSITQLTGVTGPVTSSLCETVDPLLEPVGGLLGGIVPTADDCVLDVADLGTVEGLLATVQGLLEELLGNVLGVLDVTSLLSVGDVQAGMVAKATDSVETSEADVVASIGSLGVGDGLPLVSDIDLTQGLDVLSGVSDTVTGALDGVLGVVGLNGLLDVDVMEITEVVAPDGNYTSALSSLNMLGISIAPLVGILQTDPGPAEGSAADLVPGLLGSTGGGMLDLGELLGGVTSILTEGVGINVGTMQSEGFFTPVAALPPGPVDPPADVSTPDGKLPRTGTNTVLPAALAVLLAAAALGVRRIVRTEKVDA